MASCFLLSIQVNSSYYFDKARLVLKRNYFPLFKEKGRFLGTWRNYFPLYEGIRWGKRLKRANSGINDRADQKIKQKTMNSGKKDRLAPQTSE